MRKQRNVADLGQPNAYVHNPISRLIWVARRFSAVVTDCFEFGFWPCPSQLRFSEVRSLDSRGRLSLREFFRRL
jgi:hypothetical protein